MQTEEKQHASILEVQNFVNENIGKRIRILMKNKHGKLIKEFVGNIISKHTSHFVLRAEINNNFINKSFAYVDFLTDELSIENI